MTRSIPDSPPPLSEQSSYPEPEQPHDAGETLLSDIRQISITTIRATDLTLGLRWIPAGFYVKVQVDNSDVYWQTTNKPVHVYLDVLEWNEQIVLPLKTPCNIRFSVYASFELGPMLGHGYLLRTFKISVAELLNRSRNSRPIAFQPENGEVISPCTSLLILVEQTLACKTDVDVLSPIILSTRCDTSELTLKTDTGHIILGRYRRTRNNMDLGQSIAYFERSRDLCPVDHPCRSAALVNLAIAKFISFQVNENYPDLDIAIALFQDALDLRPTGHPDQPVTLLHLVIALLSRFVKRGFQTDNRAAEELMKEFIPVVNPSIFKSALFAIDYFRLHMSGRTSDSDYLEEALLTIRRISLLHELAYRVELYHESNDPNVLDEAIHVHFEALKCFSAADVIRAVLLHTLGGYLRIRSERRGNHKDLDEEAVALHEETVSLPPVGHPDRSASLDNLSVALLLRWLQGGCINDKDLDEVVALREEAVSLRPVGHPDRSASLYNLANTLWYRFEKGRNDKDFHKAVALHKEALSSRPVGHPDRFVSLDRLAVVLFGRFEQGGDGKYLDEAVAIYEEAVSLRPIGHPGRSASLHSLAVALFGRFEQGGNDKDLDEAVALHEEVVSLRPVGHPGRSASLHSLAVALFRRFEKGGIGKDLDEAIALQRGVTLLEPVGNPSWCSSSLNLAAILSARFEWRGNYKDLDDSIALHEDVLNFFPVGHSDRCISLSNLACALSTRFDHRGDEKDLDKAIMLYKESLTLQPVNHPDRISPLNNLSNALQTRFKNRGNDEDIDEAISHSEKAVTSPLIARHNRYIFLTSLANAFTARFDRRGNDKDLDDAIMLRREVLDLLPVGHRARPASLNNLAGGLSTRWQHRGRLEDLEVAIMFNREALALRPYGQPNRFISLTQLANVLCNHAGNFNEAIALYREALTLRPVGHPARFASLTSLANALTQRPPLGAPLQQSDIKDLHEAIILHKEAVDLWPLNHPDRSKGICNLASSLFVCFAHKGKRKDLDEALANARFALTLLTEYDPDYSGANVLLALIHMLFHKLGAIGPGNDTDHLSAAMHHFKAAVDSVSSGLLYRLQTSLSWVRAAEQYAHSTLLDAYATSIQLLDAYMSATASVSLRHHAMKEFPTTLAVDAASCALQCDKVCRAVELLEQGRTLIWTQMARFRTPFDCLLKRGDYAQALAKKFREISSLLDNRPAELPNGTSKIKEEAAATRYSRLVDEWNGTVQEIRKVEGFSHFMLPPLFPDLQDAARDGPIIVLIANKSFCDAIIITHKHSPIRVQLRTSLERLGCLVTTLQQTVQVGPQGNQARLIETVKTEPEAVPQQKQTRLIEVLRELWVDVVWHVVENLDRFAQPGSRIWWCPTFIFNFLPLHAAGEYRPSGKNLSHSYVSSYTPSLTALIRARVNRDRSLPIPFAAIGQNHPQGFEHPLSSVEPELELVRSLLPPSPAVSFTKVTSVESTKSRALRTLRDNQWLHFACHGKQDFAEPFKSAFLMRDQPLTLLDITQTDLSRHQFAFLSACETAVGVMDNPDEAIHLAAGLQFAGVKSVIGTFWSVEDATVQRLVKEFYKNLCRPGDGNMNSKRAARALHKAVRTLANDKDIALEQRIVFMHIGL